MKEPSRSQWSLEDDGHTPPRVRTIHRILCRRTIWSARRPKKRPRVLLPTLAEPLGFERPLACSTAASVAMR